MAVVFDANILIDLFNVRLSGDRRAKLDDLIDSLTRSRTKVLIPTPSLTELMVGASKAREAYFDRLGKSSVFVIAPFDQRAAMECALLLGESWSKGEQKRISRTKFKFDWQIVSIAASREAATIYSDDPDVKRAAQRVNIPVFSIDDIPLPEKARQLPLLDQAPGGHPTSDE
jgi:predicted nucleic acid-binding protein